MNRQRNIVILAIIACILSAAFGSGDRLCLKNSERCMRNEECCDGCCHQEKCVKYADTCIKENNPCHDFPCPSDKVCYLHQVYCIQAPCPPIPACKPRDPDYD